VFVLNRLKMNDGWKISLRISVTMLAMTLLVGAVFYFTRMELPVLFAAVPVYFILASVVLGYVVNKNMAKKELISIGGMMGIRSLFVFGALLVLVAGLFFDKGHAVGFTILFVGFYIVFSIFETQALVMLNKKKDIQ